MARTTGETGGSGKRRKKAKKRAGGALRKAMGKMRGSLKERLEARDAAVKNLASRASRRLSASDIAELKKLQGPSIPRAKPSPLTKKRKK